MTTTRRRSSTIGRSKRPQVGRWMDEMYAPRADPKPEPVRSLFRDTLLSRSDMRYAELDRENPEAKSLMTSAKRVALARHSGKPAERPLTTLRTRLEALDTADLGVLAHIVMLWHPTTHAAATGQGGIWAMATRIVNDTARQILKTRPAFELIE